MRLSRYRFRCTAIKRISGCETLPDKRNITGENRKYPLTKMKLCTFNNVVPKTGFHKTKRGKKSGKEKLFLSGDILSKYVEYGDNRGKWRILVQNCAIFPLSFLCEK